MMTTRLESALRLEFPSVQAWKLRAWLELVKPRITVMILLVAIAGFWLASDAPPDWSRMLAPAAGIAMLAAGIFAINQYLERDLDALMRRTETRPLPAGKLTPDQALWFGVAASVLAVLSLSLLVNFLSGLLALITAGSYLFLYTPLKRRTPHCTLIGAFPGAMPPLIGWAAARGRLSVEAWVLFGILFLWQFPHFHSIAWLYREDYGRARIRMWPVIEAGGRVTAWQIAAFSSMLLPVSLLPAYLQLSGRAYLWAALILGVMFLYFSIRTALAMSRTRARQLLLASVLYLPLLFLMMMLAKH